MYEKIDNHVEIAQDRQVWQYKKLPNWDALIDIHVSRVQGMEDVQFKFLTDLLLINAVGAQLDLWGEDYNLLREGESDDDFRARILVTINLLRKSGQVSALLTNLQNLVPLNDIALVQVFPLTVLMWIFVDDFGDITSEEAARINSTMQEVKAAGIRLDIGLQLKSTAFIVSKNPAGGLAGEGVATSPAGTDGGAFVKSLNTV